MVRQNNCIIKKAKKNNGELPMYLVRNHHEPIITRAEFNRVQEEMARRTSKQKIAEKFSKTEQGRYSAKYALSELLVCGECGAHYRRVTWTAKGYKVYCNLTPLGLDNDGAVKNSKNPCKATVKCGFAGIYFFKFGVFTAPLLTLISLFDIIKPLIIFYFNWNSRCSSSAIFGKRYLHSSSI